MSPLPDRSTERPVVTPTSVVLVVEGVLAGRRVRARWCDRVLVGDPELIVAAQAVIRGGSVAMDGGRRVAASLGDLDGAAVALTRALDRVLAAEVSVVPAPATAPAAPETRSMPSLSRPELVRR